ncbi:MAG: Mov34/MPN/PAD-1 family protein [Lachnospiraceae bacterium]|nr:Mov34/MPN/PAD-1 family protein [Lachnospiraceae bacterium]
MKSKISERLKLKQVELCAPQYKEFLEALEVNSTINTLGLYESEIENGLFIEAEVTISIPTGGVYNNLDIRNKERILIFLKSEYPFSAPAVMAMREDFPFSFIPHLNMGVSQSKVEELNLCLHRGNIDEWFSEHGAMEFCDLINEWFSDLVNGELIKQDGFECVRISNSIWVMVADYEALDRRITNDTREKGHYILSLSIIGSYMKVGNEDYNVDGKHFPCILVFDKKVNTEYFSGNLEVASDLKTFYSYKNLNHAIQKYRNIYYDPNNRSPLLNNGIFIILAVKRPQQVIGNFGKFEFLAFWMEFDFSQNPYIDNCPIKNMLALQSLNCKITERLSGTQFKKEDIVVWGCGALGSKVSMEMARMGYLSQKLYDNDILLPHNLVRHEIASGYAIGLNKGRALELEIKSMYGEDTKISAFDSSSFSCEENLNNEMIIDCTASERSLNWCCTNNKIRNRLIRCEIFMEGKLGTVFVEGKNRNPDAYDMRVCLWYSAMSNEVVKQWLNQDIEEIMEFHIGFGCSSDTMVLDDATISNHASIVPHCFNKYSNLEHGTLIINYFDKDELTNNFIKVIEVKKYESWKTDEGWVVHCPCDILEQLTKITYEDTENMGIWFGHINERMKRITISDTFIPEDNKRSTGTVIGGGQGVGEKINKIVKNTGGMINYIGEWHTHPTGYAHPSQMDKKAFKSIPKNNRPYLMTIFSPNNVGNWVLL